MKQISISRPDRRTRHAASALPIVLALLLLLSALVLAFLARTNLDFQNTKASSSMARNELLERVAVETILGDLRAEMIAGSSNNTNTNRLPLVVTNAWAMVPARVVSTNIQATNFEPGGDFANLVKQSLSGREFFKDEAAGSGVPPKGTYGTNARTKRAGDVNTSVHSVNGRFITAERWNFPRLLSGSGFASNQLPDWIPITRGGVPADGTNVDISLARSNVPLSNTNCVVGRYAYNIYDTGGLLDINVAGYSPADQSAKKTNAPGKGALVWAELAALPVNPGVDPAALVAWRNRISQSSYFTNMISGTNSSLRKGFLTPFSSDTNNSDNYFFTRQDLIRYSLANSNAIPTNALPFLTTFSREIDQPSFAPFPDRPKVFADRAGGGNTEFGNDDVVNPNLAAASYNDGNRTDSPLPRRFPLSRLSEVATDPDARTGTEADIRKHFGLSWNEEKDGQVPAKCWKYEEQNSDGKIRTLAEVKGSGREANFIELLKAAISAGSLGGQAWPLAGTNYLQSVHGNIGGAGSEEGSVDRHIIQIAANIIDQADADSLPTRIYFAPASKSGCGRTYYGREDLPYLYQIAFYLYRKSAIPKDNLCAFPDNNANYPFPTYKSFIMAHPIVWMPHSSAVAPSGGFLPDRFRVITMSTAYARYDIEETTDRPSSSNCESVRVGTQIPWWTPFWTGNTTTTYSQTDISKWVGGTGLLESGNQTQFNSVLIADDPDLSAKTRKFEPVKDYLEFELSDRNTLRQPMILQVRGAPGISYLDGSSSDSGFLASQDTCFDTEMIDTDVLPKSTQVFGFNCGYVLAGPFLLEVAARDANGDVITDAKGNKSTVIRNLIGYRVETTTLADFQYALEYLDSGGHWVIYDVLRGVHGFSTGRANAVAEGTTKFADASNNYNGYGLIGKIDPRTDRFGPRTSNGFNPRPTFNYSFARTLLHRAANQTDRDSNDSINGMNPSREFGVDAAGLASLWVKPPSSDPSSGTVERPGWLEFNQDTQSYYYKDPDKIARPGDGAVSGVATDIKDPNGKMLQESNFPSRPMILNRPFRSVGELGYAFRDQPFKTLSFSDPRSADAALLDVFCIEETNPTADGIPVTAGKINLNSRQPAVLQAVLQGVLKANAETNVPTLTATEARKIAAAVTAWTSNATAAGGGPFMNPSEIAGKSTGPNAADYRGFSSQLPALLADSKDKAIKERREAVARAFAGSTQTRTWNLLLDIIVQNGKYPISAKSSSQFLVEGERRYWVHLAIDRFTLEVIDQKTELVSE